MKLEEKQLSHKLVYECFFMKLYEDDVLLPNDKTGKRIYLQHSSAAAVLPLTKDGKVILVKQYRYPIRSLSIEIPAGKKDEINELGIVCATRELEEETGYRSDNFEAMMDINSCVGYSNEVIELFIARDCYKVENPLSADEDEFVEVMEFTLAECLELIKNKTIKDAKTIIALQQYFLEAANV
ncbi:MAG: NUDIX hydrolase [Tenericutes bacterium]|nr:NUDIX hydrolase [Mycoplasmatota bacterium]